MKEVQSNRDHKILQRNLDKIQQWSGIWLMKLNPGKYIPDDGKRTVSTILGKTNYKTCYERNLRVDIMLN